MPRLGLRIALSLVTHNDWQRLLCVQDGFDGCGATDTCLAAGTQVQTAPQDGDEVLPSLSHVRQAAPRLWLSARTSDGVQTIKVEHHEEDILDDHVDRRASMFVCWSFLHVAGHR